jgi:flagellar assembly protein FliH
MGTAKKYLFDVSFDHAAAPTAPTPAAAPVPVVEDKVSLAELEASRQAAFAEGRSAGLAEASEAVNTKATVALETIAKDLAALLEAQDARVAEAQRQAIEALRVIVAKTLPTLATRAPLAEIEALAGKYLIDAIDEPRIVLRVANEVYEPVRDRLDAIAASSGYSGRIVLLADEHLSSGDARIEWADGGVERNLAEQLNEIDAAMARISDPAAVPTPVSP